MVEVKFWYNTIRDEIGIIGEQPIEEKCEFIERQLLASKPALNDSYMTEFAARIDQNERHNFRDYSQLLEYIGNRFLPICNSSHGYSFGITFFSKENYATSIISSILQMSEIKRCSNIEFTFQIHRGKQIQLPIEAISSWLEWPFDVMENSVQKQKERHLTIGFYGHRRVIKNVREMLDQLKKVYFKSFLNLQYLNDF